MTVGPSSALDALRGSFEHAQIDALVVSARPNVRYLSGFTGSAGALVVDRTSATLVTDGRYEIQARSECAATDGSIEVVIGQGAGRAELLASLAGAGRIGLEADHVSWSTSRELEDAIESALTPTSGLVERLRERKRTDEVERIGAAAAIADRALADVLVRMRGGVILDLTERDLAAELDSACRRLGADRAAFETIVASGPNAARPHHRPDRRRIREGDLLIVDFGAELAGYRSDMTRTFAVGEVSDRALEMLREVAASQAAGVAAAGPGVRVADVDAACRNHLDSVGLGDWFTHGTGHGVGLDIHEAPWVNARSTAELVPGHVITVEPGVYIPELGGVRWEDTVAITADGAAPLTHAPKEPVLEVG